MARKQNSFMRNFWSETGRNSGKWLSNKIFGPTGWATPKRIIFDNLENSTGKQTLKSNDFLYDDIESEENVNSSNEEWNNESKEEQLYKETKEEQFNSKDADQIVAQLDRTLSAAYYAMEHDIDVSMFVSRIRSGILLLRRLNEVELANHYEKESRRINRKKILKITGMVVFIVILFLAVLLMVGPDLFNS